MIKITVLEHGQKLNKDLKIIKGEQTDTNKFPDKRETKPEKYMGRNEKEKKNRRDFSFQK